MNATHVFHKITLPNRRSRFSAWFAGDPTGRAASLALLIDAERIDARGRCYPVTERERAALIAGPWYARHVATLGNGGA